MKAVCLNVLFSSCTIFWSSAFEIEPLDWHTDTGKGAPLFHNLDSLCVTINMSLVNFVASFGPLNTYSVKHACDLDCVLETFDEMQQLLIFLWQER